MKSPAAAAVSVPANAMAVAADSDLETGPTRRTPAPLPAMPDAPQAHYGLFANLPKNTPIPRTTEVQPPKVRALLDRIEKNIFEEVENDFSSPDPVSQTPAQATQDITPSPARSSPGAAVRPAVDRQQPALDAVRATSPATPVDPRLTRAAAMDAQADQLQAQVDAQMQRYMQQPDEATGIMLQMQSQRASDMRMQAQALRDRVSTDSVVERRLQMMDRELSQKVPDTLANNYGDFANVVRERGLSAAVKSAVRQEMAGLLAKGVPLAPEQATLMTGQYAVMGGGVMLADRLAAGQALSQRDPSVVALSALIKEAQPLDAAARREMVNEIVGSAAQQRQLNPALAQRLAEQLTIMVEANVLGK